MMTEVDRGGDITRGNLVCHGISYDPRVYRPDKASTHASTLTLPDHVDAIREALLSFDRTIPEEWEEDLRDEFKKYEEENFCSTWTHQPPDSAFIRLTKRQRNRPDRSADWTKADENFKRFETVVKRVHELLEDAEAEWNVFWRSKVFMPFSDEVYHQHGYK
jgi:hypothetical protein